MMMYWFPKCDLIGKWPVLSVYSLLRQGVHFNEDLIGQHTFETRGSGGQCCR